MIYVTVGTQLPFPRLIKAINDCAAEKGYEVFAQIGPDDGDYPAIRTEAFVSPAEADTLIQKADLVVAHAGMGTIITASQYGKPLVVMPRQFRFGEHRNDHQVATAKRFCDFPNIEVVESDEALNVVIGRFLDSASDTSYQQASQFAPKEFTDALKELLSD